MATSPNKEKWYLWPLSEITSIRQSRGSKAHLDSVGDDGTLESNATDVVNPDLKVVHRSSSSAASSDTITAKPDRARCSCCDKDLHHTSTNCIPAGVKTYSCSMCLGNVCKNCKGQCHECTIKARVELEPEVLLQMDRIELLDCLKRLHYPMQTFENWEKGYLVKQILTRFQKHTDWNPEKKSAKTTKESRGEQSNNSNSEAAKSAKTTDGDTSNQRAASVTKDLLEKHSDRELLRNIVPAEQQQTQENQKKEVKSRELVGRSVFYNDVNQHKASQPNGNDKTRAHKGSNQNVSGSNEQLMVKTVKTSQQDVISEKVRHKPRKGTRKFPKELNDSGAYQDLKLVVSLSDVAVATNTTAQHQDNSPGKEPVKTSQEALSTETTVSKKSNRQQGNVTKPNEDQRKAVDGTKDDTKRPNDKQAKSAVATVPEIASGKADMSTPELIKRLLLMNVRDDSVERCNSLKDISSMKDIDELDSKEMKSILRKHSIDMKSLTNDQEMRYAVIRLWRYKKEKENEALVTGSNDRIQATIRKENPQFSDEKESKDRNGKTVQRSKSMASIPTTVPTLRNIATEKDIERLDDAQLSCILRYHNFTPEKFKKKHHMVYAVKCLWKVEHATEHGKSLKTSTPKEIPPVKTAADSGQLTKATVESGHLMKIPSIEDFRTVHELEKLSVQQMRTILKKYSVTTERHHEKHEIYYAILLLWNSKKIAEKQVPAAQLPSEDIRQQKTEYVQKWLLENSENMPGRASKEVKPKERPPRTVSESALTKGPTQSPVVYATVTNGQTTLLAKEARVKEKAPAAITTNTDEGKQTIATKKPLVDVQHSKEVVTPEVMYAQILRQPNQDENAPSIVSFGEAIAPKALQEEFEYIDETFSVASVNQATTKVLT